MIRSYEFLPPLTLVIAASGLVAQAGGPIPWHEVDLPAVGSSSWTARAWTVAEGLPQDTVTALTQTPDGYLWIGTFAGLARYDGTRFTIFDVTTTPELASNRITALCADTDGRLWIAADVLTVLEEGRFRVPPARAGVRPIERLEAHPEGGVRINGRMRHTGTEVLRDDGPNESRELRREIDDRSVADRQASGHVFDACRDRQGRIWIAAGNGLFVAGIDTETGAIATRRALPAQRTKLVRCVLEDRSGNVWAGTEGRGLLRIRRQPTVRFEGEKVPGAGTCLVRASRDGGWWFARTQRCSIWRFRDGGFALALSGDEVRENAPRARPGPLRAILEAEDGALWVAAMGMLSRFHRGSSRSFDLDEPIFTLVQARDGAIWCGGAPTLMRVEGSEIRTFATAGLPRRAVLALSEAPDGSMWFGGAFGVGRVRNERSELLVPKQTLRAEVRALHHDRDGGTWIGTYGGGIARYEGGRVTRCTTAHGLPDNAISAIQRADDGTLWINSNRGVFGIRESALVDFAEGRRTHVHARLLGTPEGDGRGGATSGGRICFPTVKGLVVFDPARVEAEARPATVVLERAVSRTLEHDATSVILLPADDREVSFSFASPSLGEFDNTYYQYRLVGYDDRWVDAGRERTATYRRLPPGDFRFEVRASNGDGLVTESTTTIDVVVAPRFHETRWFLALAVIAGGLAIVGLHRLRTRHYRAHNRALVGAQEAERRRIARDLHDDFSQRLAGISIDLAASRRQLGDAMNGEGEQLDLVNARVREVADDIHVLSRQLHPSTIEDLGLVAALESEGRAWSRRAGIRVDFRVAPQLPTLTGDVAITLYRVLQEALRNVEKHARADAVEVDAFRDGADAVMRVRDNGVGLDRIPDGRRAGIGLRSMRERVELLGGRMRLRSEPGRGATVEVRLPLPTKTR